MTLIERYRNGETTAVYAHIASLGQHAFLPERFSDVEAVLVETFERAAYNFDIIYAELKNIGWSFWDIPFHKPLPGMENLLKQLNASVLLLGDAVVFDA